MVKRIYLLLVSTLIAFSSLGQGGLQFNELGFSKSENSSSFYIELYNSSNTSIETVRYRLFFGSTEMQILDSTEVMPGAFYVVDSLNSSLLLNGNGIYLLNVNLSDTLDVIWVEAIADSSYYLAKLPDGIGTWSRVTSESKGRYNEMDYFPTEKKPINWEKITDHAAFSPRDGAGSVVFNDEMWLLGGWENGPLSNEIWKSSDGINWTLVANAPWPGRHSAGFIVFNDKLWVVGGDLHADVWSSENGIDWQLMSDTPPWGKRYCPYVAVFNGKIWFMGGLTWLESFPGVYDFSHVIGYNDVWSSVNGYDWVLENAEAPWAPRGLIHGSVVFDEKLWIMGGGLKGYNTVVDYNDIWNTSDGVTWTRVVEHAPWVPRTHFSSIVYNDKIWITDGSINGNQGNISNEVWNSENGVDWERIITDNTFNNTHASSLFNYKGSLWLVAGFLYNYVWKITDRPKTYYLKPNGYYADVNDWGTEPDGEGSAPITFNEPNNVFVFANQAKVIVNSNFNVNGYNSKIIIGNGLTPTVVEVTSGGELSAEVDVMNNSELVVNNPILPRIGRLFNNSTLTINAGIDTIPEIPYYNLFLNSTAILKLPRNLSIYGDADITCQSIQFSENGSITSFGNLELSTNDPLDTLPALKIFGQKNQLISCNSPIVAETLLVNKTSGFTFFITPITTLKNAFYHFGGTAIGRFPLTGIQGRGSLQILAQTTGNLNSKTRVTYETDSLLKNVLQLKKVHFRAVSISQNINDSLLLLDSHIQADTFHITLNNEEKINFGKVNLQVSEELKISHDNDQPINLESLSVSLVSAGNCNLVTSNSVTMSSLSVNVHDDLQFTDDLEILDTITFVQGSIISSQKIKVGSQAHIVFIGAEDKTFSDYIPSVESIKSLEVRCPLLNIGRLSVQDLYLHGNLISTDTFTVTNKIVSSGKNGIISNQGIGVKVTVNNEFFLPLIRDSVYMAARFTPQGSDTANLYIDVLPVDEKGSLLYGLNVVNLSDRNSDMMVSMYWTKQMQSDQFNESLVGLYFYGQTGIESPFPLDVEVIDFDLFSVSATLKLSKGLLVVSSETSGKFKRSQIYKCPINSNFNFLSDPLEMPATTLQGLEVFLSLPEETHSAQLAGNLVQALSPGIVEVNVSNKGDSVYLGLNTHCIIEVTQAAQHYNCPLKSLIFDQKDYLQVELQTDLGLPVDLTVDGPAYLSGDKLFFLESGVFNMNVKENGSQNVMPLNVNCQIDVSKGNAGLDFSLPATIEIGEVIELNASTEVVGLPITFSIADSSAGIIDGNLFYPLTSGEVEIIAAHSETPKYFAAHILKSILILERIPKIELTAVFSDAQSLVVQGKILDNGGADGAIRYGVCLSSMGSPTIDDFKVEAFNSNHIFEFIIDDLPVGTTYNVRPFVQNSRSFEYGSEINLVSLPAINFNSFVDIYPSHILDKLYLRSTLWDGKEVTLKIVDITGGVLFEKSLLISSQSQEVNLSLLQPGIYFIHVTNSTNGVQVCKVMKK